MKNLADFKAILHAAPVVPVLTIENAEQAGPLAKALASGGLRAIEVTLRTPDALVALTEMKRAVPDLCVGAGTVLSEGDSDAAMTAGADFLVTPGTAPALREALLDQDIIIVPGIATPSEAMMCSEMGFDLQKFFPAAASGGPAFLKALSGPLSHIAFMPTGGVTAANAEDYLALTNVLAVGGSWIATNAEIASGDWGAIEQKARAAAALQSQR